MQEFQTDVIVATTMNLCAQVLASKLDKSFINYFPAGPIDPFFTSIYPDSNRRAFMPNPLSYNPQGGSVGVTQHMVSCCSLHMCCSSETLKQYPFNCGQHFC